MNLLLQQKNKKSIEDKSFINYAKNYINYLFNDNFFN